MQSDVDANQTASESADSALSGRLDVLEADPTTQTLLDAETSAREEGDLNAIGQSNAYTDGLFNQYFSGAADEVQSDSYTAVIQAGFTPTVDATAGQFKFNNTDVASGGHRWGQDATIHIRMSSWFPPQRTPQMVVVFPRILPFCQDCLTWKIGKTAGNDP